jgi:hypothetical protein
MSLISCKGGSPLQKSPGEVVQAYNIACNEGKYSDVKVLFSEDVQKMIAGDMGQLAGGIKGVCDKDTRDGTVTKVDIVSQDIRGEGATVIATIFFKDGTKKNDDKTVLIKENGAWRITAGGN